VHLCITLSYAAVVFDVPLKSAKTHSSDTDSAKNIKHVGEHSQNHVYWRAAQWTPIPHSSNRICTCRAETGVAARHKCYAVTWNQ